MESSANSEDQNSLLLNSYESERLSRERRLYNEALDKARTPWLESKSMADHHDWALQCAVYLGSDAAKFSGEHWYCGSQEMFERASRAMFLFSFKISETDRCYPWFLKFKQAHTAMLSECSECAIKYQTVCHLDLAEFYSEHFGSQKAQEAMQIIYRYDRQRILSQLDQNPDSIPIMTEALWCNACLCSTNFIGKCYKAKAFQSSSNNTSLNYGICPGYLMFFFLLKDPKLRHVGGRNLFKPSASKVCETWKSAPAIFKNVFKTALKRYSHAAKLADLSWYHSYMLLKAFQVDAQVANDIIQIVVKEMSQGTGLPRFGAHAFIMQALKAHHVNPKIHILDDDLENLINYAVKFTNPETHADLPEDMEKSTVSQSYLGLDAQVVVEWFRCYVEFIKKPTFLKDRFNYMISFKESAFNAKSGYDRASLSALKAAALFPDELFHTVLNVHVHRLVSVSSMFNSEYVDKLWKYQLEHESEWASFWDLWAKDPEVGHNLLSSPERITVILRILQGCHDLGLRWPAPKKVAPKEQPTPTPAECFITSLLESLNDYGNAEYYSYICQTKQCLHTLLLLTVSGNRNLSMSAEEFLNIAFNEDSFENSISKLINDHPDAVLSVINKILTNVSSVETRYLAAMPGIIRLASRSLDEIYDVNDGIDTVNNENILINLQLFWAQSWKLITNAIKQFRSWAQEYSVSHLKLVISHCVDFSKALLNKFRLLEGDLGSLSNVKDWGTELSTPVISCVNNMSELLRLKDPEYVTSVFQVMMEMLGLMNSFKVEAPASLLSFLEQLATRKLSSNLNPTQLKILLGALGLSQMEIYRVVEERRLGILYKPSHQGSNDNQTVAPRTTTGSFQSEITDSVSQTRYNSRTDTRQKSINDFFSANSGVRNAFSPRIIVNNQVIPIAGQQMSAMSQLRAQFASQKQPGLINTANKPIQKQTCNIIHPERPPGFNIPKPSNKPGNDYEHNDDSDEADDDDDDGVLGALGTKTKAQEDRLAKLRIAYEASKSSKATLMPIVDESVLLKTKTFSSVLEEQQEREKRAMKARLLTQPTELHRIILRWNYFDTRPPLSPKDGILDKFESVKQYQDVMSPLLYLEAWEGIQKFKEEIEKYPPKIFGLVLGKRINVDGFTDVYVSMAMDEFSKVGLADGDFLLLSYDKSQPGKLIEPLDNLPHFLARIKESSIQKAKNPKKQHVDFQIRLNADPKILAPLNLGEVVYGKAIGNLRTVEREFTALMALPHYNLLDNILQARPSISTDDANEIVRFQKNLSLNKSQATAVSRAITASGFSLIQGPPGTGKTKTILGIIGALLTNSPFKIQTTGDSLDYDKKILVCAPSNAAVDEIVLRLKDGIVDANGKHQKPSIVRLGRIEMVSEQVRDCTLDEQISKAMGKTADLTDSQLRHEHSQLIERRNDLRESLKLERGKACSAETISEILAQLGNLNTQIRQKTSELKEQGERLGQVRRQRDVMYREQQNEILQKTQIVCTTLSASAHPILSNLGITFETVIIDEAAQCIELSALIPLKYGCKKCIMVGDPNQLPPTVISQEASKLKYEQSLFVRIYNQHSSVPGAISMLDTQFRMHTEISKFPSSEFYSGKLLDGEGLDNKLQRPWHFMHKALGPYTFFAVKGAEERYNGHSLRNVTEANAALALVRYVLKEFPNINSIGIITPYKEQVRLLRQIFVQSLGTTITSKIDFNSIDGFQGQEKDLIVMSCVRAVDASTNDIGFIGDVRRMNVAITRAKASLWIIGNPESLVTNPVWRRLINDASRRNRLVECYSANIIEAIKRFDRNAAQVMKKSELSQVSTVPLKRPYILNQSEDDYNDSEHQFLKQANDNSSGCRSEVDVSKSTSTEIKKPKSDDKKFVEAIDQFEVAYEPSLASGTSRKNPSQLTGTNDSPGCQTKPNKSVKPKKKSPSIFIKQRPKKS